MTNTPSAPKWPQHPFHEPCRDGSACGENGYCVPCPSRPQPAYNPEDAAFKKPVDAHYQRTYKGILLDPYRIAVVWGMQGGPREHIMKKCLRVTEKGHTEQEVVNEIRSTLNRWQAMLDEDAAS